MQSSLIPSGAFRYTNLFCFQLVPFSFLKKGIPLAAQKDFLARQFSPGYPCVYHTSLLRKPGIIHNQPFFNNFKCPHKLLAAHFSGLRYRRHLPARSSPGSEPPEPPCAATNLYTISFLANHKPVNSCPRSNALKHYFHYGCYPQLIIPFYQK